MSNKETTFYTIQRGAGGSYLTIDDAIAAAKNKLLDYPTSSFYILSAEKRVSSITPTSEVTQLYFDWDVNYKKPEKTQAVPQNCNSLFD